MLLQTQVAATCPNCWWKVFGLMLVPFLLGLLLGYLLWAAYKKISAQLEKDRDDWHHKFVGMEKDYASLKYQYEELQKEIPALKADLHACEADKAVADARYLRIKNEWDQFKIDQSAAMPPAAVTAVPPAEPAPVVAPVVEPAGPVANQYTAVFGTDNLQIIEGIGPKIDRVLKDAGYTTWAALAAASHADLNAVLEKAGPQYRIHNAETWPLQAKLAADDRWEELIELQKHLDTGREDKGDFETPSKVETLMVRLLGFSSRPDDLKIVEGIGPKIEELLKNAGIDNWAQLAQTSVERIREILEAGGDRFRLADPATWPQQASLAAEGRWTELKELQSFLDGGKTPG